MQCVKVTWRPLRAVEHVQRMRHETAFWIRQRNQGRPLAVRSSRVAPSRPPTPHSSRSARVNRFTYAIRNIVAEAQRVEAAGTRVRYLNIGDPVAFGFKTPPHLIDGGRARDARRPQRLRPVGRHPAGARSGRGTNTRRAAFPISADRVFITAGTSEGIELALSALVDDGRRSARADADLSALHGGARQDRRARAATTAPIRRAAGCRTSITSRAWSRRRRARSSSSIRTTRPARSTRPRRGARCSTSPSGTASRSSPTRSTAISATTGRSRRSAASIPTRRSSRSRACRRRISRPAGAPAGWRSAARRGWTTCVGGDEEAGRRAAVQHRADAVRHRRRAQRRPLAPAGVPRGAEGARGRSRCERLSAMPGIDVRRADRGVLRDAEDRAAAGTHRRGLRARRCCARPACCASTAPASACRAGRRLPAHRVPRAASTNCGEIYDLMAAFTADIPARVDRQRLTIA